MKSLWRLSKLGRRSFTAAAAARQDNRIAYSSKWGLLKKAGALTTIGLGGWALLEDGDRRRRFKLLWVIPTRLARDVFTATAIAADYELSLWGVEGSKEREIAKHEAHVRCANRLRDLCFKNGGIYIKLGQHIGQLEYLLPQEYVEIMRNSLLDRCPVSSYKQVCDTFIAELGKLPDEVFLEFDPVPLASASLAQVHAARTRDGQRVAVKVQHTHLTDTAAADTTTVAIIVHILRWMFPAFDYRWLVDEVKETLPQELDFTKEARNSEICIQNFRKLSPKLAPFIAVPEIHWSLSTSKLLTMEFMEGVKVTDVKKIKESGLRPKDVAKLISQAFAEMIFHHGFVHCDPHAANMLIRQAPGANKKPQLVILDHGMYKTLDPYIRAHYAGLWKALVFADADKIKEHSLSLGAGDLYILFAGVVTMRPWNQIVDPSIDHLKLPDSEKGRAEIQMYASQYVTELSALLSRLPRVILMLLKTNDCLRAVDKTLGAPVNTFVIIGRESARAAAEIELQRSKGFFWLWFKFLIIIDRLRIEFRLLALQLAAWAISFQQWSKYLSQPLLTQN